MKNIVSKLILPFAVVALGTTAFAGNALSTDSRITHELTMAAVADEIRNQCPTISAKMSVALPKALALRNYALGLGFTSDEIQDFLDDKAEQNRIYALRDQYLSENGVIKSDPDTYCTLGKAEIEKGSLLGSVLKMN